MVSLLTLLSSTEAVEQGWGTWVQEVAILFGIINFDCKMKVKANTVVTILLGMDGMGFGNMGGRMGGGKTDVYFAEYAQKIGRF